LAPRDITEIKVIRAARVLLVPVATEARRDLVATREIPALQVPLASVVLLVMLVSVVHLA